MKILLVDVESCYFCPCCTTEVGWLGDIRKSQCQVTGKENTVYMDAVSGVPKWCPLKPIPKKKNEEIAIKGHTGEIAEAFQDGWNACLEEIEQ